jgi:hypothetical protein
MLIGKYNDLTHSVKTQNPGSGSYLNGSAAITKAKAKILEQIVMIVEDSEFQSSYSTKLASET